VIICPVTPLHIVRADGAPGTVVRRTAVAGEDALLVVPESALEALHRDVMAAKLPPLYMGEMYALKMRIGFVRERLEAHRRSQARRSGRAAP
jgi:hypothetical protein